MVKCSKCGKECDKELAEIVICDECQANYENDLNAKTPALDYDDDEDESVSNIDKIKKVFNKLRQLDLFNTKLIYGAFELGYLDDDYDCITVQAEEKSNDEKGIRLIDNCELICNGESIILHISVIVKSDYTRINRVNLVFNEIKEAFKKEYERTK